MSECEKIDFYYSIGSRYSYLAFTQIDALQAATNCQIDWHPINSVRLISQRKHNPFADKHSGQYAWNYRELDAQRWAKLYGVTYLEPRGRVQFDSELLALACIAARRFGKVAAYSRLLFAAMFQDSVTKIDDRECISRAELCGINAVDFQIALTEIETADRLNTNLDRAIDAGVFGVPTFIVNGELFWGNDRLILLRHYLDSHQQDF
jgi:2-hydroxychromene-2-carboxylate isomerase